MFTSFPRAATAILLANSSARASIEPDGGTEAEMTSTPFVDNTSFIPRQY